MALFPVEVDDASAATIATVRDADVVVGQDASDTLRRGHHDELRPLTAFSTHQSDPLRIVPIEVLVNFVKVVEWTWIVILDGKDQGEGRHRLLTTRQLVTGHLRRLYRVVGPTVPVRP